MYLIEPLTKFLRFGILLNFAKPARSLRTHSTYAGAAFDATRFTTNSVGDCLVSHQVYPALLCADSVLEKGMVTVRSHSERLPPRAILNPARVV